MGGPGKGCNQCWNPETHQHGIGPEEELVDLARWVIRLKGIDGISFSGGEPMQQATDLYVLMRLIRVGRPDLSIGMFTGYTKRELEAGEFQWYEGSRARDGYGFIWSDICSNLDFAVMGRYNQRLHTNSKPLCGSSNQTVELFSDRYRLNDFAQQSTEIIISPDGQLVNITGFPASHEKLKAGLKEASCVDRTTSSPFVSPRREN